MFTWKRLIITLCVLVVAVIAFTALILPGLVKNKAEQWVADNTGRSLDVGQVSINPFNLTVNIGPLVLSENDRTVPFVTWQNLRIALSPRSIYHRAPILSEIHLVEPIVHIKRLAASTFNFSDLIPQSTQPTPSDSEAEPVRFSLNNIVIEKGRVELVDSSVDGEISHSVRDLNLAIPFFGNLPYLVEKPVQPRFSAVINDSPIELQGELTPFAEAREFSLHLALNDIDLPYYLAYLPMKLPIELRDGRLAVDLQLRYRAGMQQKPEFTLSGIVNLSALNIWDRQNQQLFFMPLLRAEIAPSHPLDQEVHLTSLDIYNLAVNVSRDQDGVWNHSRLKMAGSQSRGDKGTPGAESPPFNLQVDKFRVHDGEVHFADLLPKGGFATDARRINLRVDNFALNSTEPAPLSLDLETDFEESLAVKGQFLAAPLTIALQTEASNLNLAAYAPYYSDFYTLPLGGKLQLSAKLDITPEQPLLISEGSAQWQDAAVTFNDQEGMGVERIELDGLSFSLAENRLEVDSASATNGRMNFSRDSQGQWSLMSRRLPILTALATPADKSPGPSKKAEGPAFSYRIGKLAVNDWSFDVQDRLPANPAHLQANKFNLRLENLAAPQKVRSPFVFSTGIGRRGTVSLKGTLSLAEQSAEVNAKISRIPLVMFAPYVAEQANLVLKDGSFDANLEVSAKPGPDGFQAAFGGEIGVNRFSLLDGTHREDLLKWDSLQVAGIDGSWGPLALAVDSITVSDYFAKVLIDEEGQLNMAQVLRKEEPADGEQPASATPADSAAATGDPAGTPPDISISQVTLQGGQVDFTDRSLPRTFHADMRELGGSILGLSSNPAARAGVDLRGKLRGQSPMLIEGEVNPLAKNIYLDLKLNFSDIEMSPMSPYSGTYLGYLIEKGKLNLTLQYHVEDGKLKASNDVFLDQFTFGEPVKSDKSTGLPVKLAVALLKDGDGEIHLDIPVSGALDDPQFSVVGVVWKIIRNLLVKAATSPLALLGALVGGGEEDFSSVVFAYGSDQLAAQELAKLDSLAKALVNRPSLQLDVQGFVDPDNDPEGYRREQLRQSIERARRLDRGDQPESPAEGAAAAATLSPEEYSNYLWEVYKEAGFPKPRNFIGMLKHLPDEELEKLIYANTEVDQQTLAQLALHRAQAVRNYLVEQGGIAPARVFLTVPADITQAPQKADETRSRVDFAVTVK